MHHIRTKNVSNTTMPTTTRKKINTPYNIVKRNSYIITGCIKISSRRSSTKMTLHLCSVYWKCYILYIERIPTETLPINPVKWILKRTATFTTSTRPPSTQVSHHKQVLFCVFLLSQLILYFIFIL